MKKREPFILKMQGLDVPIIGNVVFWNIRGADVTKDQFVAMLKDAGLPEKYAKEHNYRSSFIRALKNMEEDRIIRRVSEDDAFIVYQFTAEKVVTPESKCNYCGGVEKHEPMCPVGMGEALAAAKGVVVKKGAMAKLEYQYETRVIVDKNRYYEAKNFSDAVIREIKSADGTPDYVANPEITKSVIDLYERERVRYRSGDVTRYVQKILTEEADIVSLRDQGAVYFVPARFQDVVEKVKSLVDKIAMGSSFEYLPIPDAAASRDTVASSVIGDLKGAIREFSDQIREAGPDVPKFMLQRFEGRIDGIKRRIGLYDEIVPETEAKKLTEEVDTLARQVFGTRTLEV